MTDDQLLRGIRVHIAHLDPARNPLDVPLRRWTQFILDARAFYDEDPGWALLAHDLGWADWELIGANDTKPYARLDSAGLVWFLDGRAMGEIDDRIATMIGRDGNVNSFTRCPIRPHGVVAPWELHAR